MLEQSPFLLHLSDGTAPTLPALPSGAPCWSKLLATRQGLLPADANLLVEP